MRGRSAYNPVASTDGSDGLVESPSTEVSSSSSITGSHSEVGGTNSTTNSTNSNSNSNDSRHTTTGSGNRRGTNNYTRIADISSKQQDVVVNASTSLVDDMENDSAAASEGGFSDSDVDCTPSSDNAITIIVLDAAQKRFPVTVDPEWKVQTFKKAGAKVHKVAPPSQRLIFRGRMLEDGKTLKELGITQSDVIIHLFPKPRVIVTGSSVTSATTQDRGDADGGGAHVPQIIMDEEEQERRGQILVLGSYEISEAQNNVRLLSLLLGTICVMRLLALLSVATGADEVPVYQDDLTPPGGDGGNRTADDGLYPHVDYEPRTWENQDYFDLLVSTIGFLVARLGMKATHENTSRLATHYLIGTMIAGILWNIWNVLEFIIFVEDETKPKDDDSAIPLTRDDFRTIALFTVLIPLGVWLLCCTRAWQFRHLIEEAEQEAAERIRSELTLSHGGSGQESAESGEGNARELDEISSSDERPSIV